MDGIEIVQVTVTEVCFMIPYKQSPPSLVLVGSQLHIANPYQLH